MVDETCLVVYLNDEVVLVCRMYDYREGEWGLLVADGELCFCNVTLRTTRGER